MVILTNSKEEYEKVTEIMKQADIDAHIHCPEDSIAMVVWSIKDAREKFPKGTPDYVIYEALKEIEGTIVDDMTERGYETIDILKDDLLKYAKAIRQRDGV